MQVAALPIPFHCAASNRPSEISHAAASRVKSLEQRRAIRAKGVSAARSVNILRTRRANLPPLAGPPPQARLREAGDASLYRNRRQSLGWLNSMEYLAERALWRRPPNPPAVSYVPNEYKG